MIHPITDPDTTSPSSDLERLLTCSAGGMTLAVRVDVVRRILRMATLSPMPGSSAAIGMVNLAGDVLPVVDSRSAMGLPTAPTHPSQYLIFIEDRSRYLLWVDTVEHMLEAHTYPAVSLRDAPRMSVAASVAQIEGKVVPVLDTRALDPTSPPTEPAS